MIKQNDTYIRRILAGETELFGKLIEKYNQQIFILIYRIVRNREDAEELTQDVFLKVYRTLSKFKGDSLFSTWLYRIAYNTAISATRKKKQEILYIEEQTIHNIPDSILDQEFETNINEEQLSALQEAIYQLTPEERGIITLFYLQQQSIDNIASVTGLTVANVKVKLHRTRKKLYVMLNNTRLNLLSL